RLQRRMGLHRGLCAAAVGLSRVGARRERAFDRGHRKIRKSKQRYQRLGVPYHRGYLFYGPPGTGKTSMVSAIGAHFGLSVYTVNLGDFNDRSLMNAVSQVSADSILLFEDLDCMKGSKARTKENAHEKPAQPDTPTQQNVVTLSGLLNVLDGFYAPTNVLFM